MDNGIWLVICGVGSDSGPGVFRIKDGCYEIGRSESCPIRLVHESVSRHHAVLVNDRGKLSIRNLGSRNGTFVDGKPVQSATLRVGSSLRIGCVTLDVVDHPFKSGRADDDSAATPRTPVRDSADAWLRAAGFGPKRKQVLSLLLDGLGEKQIAPRLDMSVPTVQWHTHAIYDALNVHTRAQLAAHFRNRDAIS